MHELKYSNVNDKRPHAQIDEHQVPVDFMLYLADFHFIL